MNKKPNRKFYFKPLERLTAAYAELNRMKVQRDVLRSSGLDREADRIERLMRDQNKTIDSIKDEIYEARKQLVRHMLLCFAAGDIATSIADRMAEVFDSLTEGIDNQGGNELADMFRRQADAWNRCVQMVDGDGEHGDQRVSMYYSDIAEEIVAKVIPDVLAIIDRHMATEKGKRLL